MRQVTKVNFPLLREQRGFSLIEMLVAVAILAAIGVVFLSALSTISKSTGLYEQRVTALGLAQSQTEIIKQAPYAANYDNVSAPTNKPAGYEITISATGNVTGKQEITVAVSRDGHHLFELKTIRADWQ